MSNSRIEMFRSKEFKSRFKKSESAIIFGGTFDPIHSGHVQDIRSLLELASTVYLAPTEKNPWKDNKPASLEDRIQMIRLVLKFEKLPFSENLSEGGNKDGLILLDEPYIYAHELASALTQKTDKTLFWAIGEDLVSGASEWKNWSSQGVPFVILPLLEGTSSTLTRNAEISPHPAITDYIKEKNLY